MANSVTSYNLADFTASQARAKGEVFFQAWTEFQRKRLARRQAEAEAAKQAVEEVA